MGLSWKDVPQDSSASPVWRNLFSRYFSQWFINCENLHMGDYRGIWVGNDLSWRQTRIRGLMTRGFPRLLPGSGVPCVGKHGFLVAHLRWSPHPATLSHLPVASSPCWVTDFPSTAAICNKTQRGLWRVGMVTKYSDCSRGKVKLLWKSG